MPGFLNTAPGPTVPARAQSDSRSRLRARSGKKLDFFKQILPCHSGENEGTTSPMLPADLLSSSGASALGGAPLIKAPLMFT